ncbi:Tat pathway signal protein [Catenulispora sp. NF23]|uniref:Tat pathway signal protein n=1 Tax=Catenulispora pinistramenti TaxID=2705254 RepID=A0ABS5KIY9_9ACTN|nr:Tat pathway signal protein [Catenulispora pinistramenti]MBS2532230.1 Tat pathway signal protein [Catenulispora pinistramenti]MBS2546369.1 Tat pathway signal protein [Catenulispora pinistramenti]
MTVFTVSFCGTACTRDEGEASRSDSDLRIYDPATGYIPVRVHKEISGDLHATGPSVTVRGVGQNDWSQPGNTSEPLMLSGPLKVPGDLLNEAQKYSGGDRRSTTSSLTGWEAAALALHGANLAAASGAQAYNFIGHSRGAVECVMAAWFLQAYGSPEVKNIPVRILAIDPVPGPGTWYGILTQLSPNVASYVGVTAWDHLDTGFNGVVPRPNARMAGSTQALTLGGDWMSLADNYQLTDPLAPPKSGAAQPTEYKLFACRGRHGTVAGNTTADGQYDPANLSPSVGRVGQLVYKLARAYLTEWGTAFAAKSAVEQPALQLRQEIHLDHAQLDAMAGGPLRDSVKPLRPYVRRVSSISGSIPWNTYYLEDVVGDPPYRQPYPVTAAAAKDGGWVRWTFL